MLGKDSRKQRTTQMHELALFAGAGGGILGGKLLGWRTVCAVEIDDYARRVLMARQDDGCIDPFPIWDDVRTFDGRPWAGLVDVVSGGFPCQDISPAGKGEGIDGARSGLWSEMARIIREVGPLHVFVENSPMLTSRGFGRVVGDLAEMGYDARWGVLSAESAGAPHRRERIWIVGTLANALRAGREELDASAEPTAPGFGGGCCHAPADTDANGDGCSARGGVATGPARSRSAHGHNPQRLFRCDWWRAEPMPSPVAHGVAARMDQIRCTGNGQVPAVVRLAWHALSPLEGQGGRVEHPNTTACNPAPSGHESKS